MDTPCEGSNPPPSSLQRMSSVDKAETETSSISSSSGESSHLRDEGITSKIKLISIYGNEPFIVNWKDGSPRTTDNVAEIVENIKSIMKRFEEVKSVVSTWCRSEGIDLENYTNISYEKIMALVKKYNKCASTSVSLWRGQTRPGGEEWALELTQPDLLRQICGTAFNRAVPDVSKLNKHYEAFSSEVYGETSYEQLELMLNYLKPNDNDVFVDLGSGVGHLVCYVAGRTHVKRAIGIEKAKFPSHCASTMETEFKKFMKWHGKRFRNFQLQQGDFLDPAFTDLITKEATIIFINNFAFTSELDTRIKEKIISQCNDGVRIISTKEYAKNKLLSDMTERDLGDVCAMLDVVDLPRVPNPASWTGKDVPYFLHTVNHKKMYEYYERKKLQQNSGGSSNDSGRRSANSSGKTSQRSSSRESAASKGGAESLTLARGISDHEILHPGIPQTFINEEGVEVIRGDDYGGMTTRRKWNEYVSQKPPKRSKNNQYEAVIWNEEDTDYMPPTKRGRPPASAKDGTPKPRGRPKKASTAELSGSGASTPQPQPKVRGRLSEEGKTGIEELHDEIVRQQLQQQAMVSSTPAPTLPEGAVVLDPLNPLDSMMINVRNLYIEFLSFMNTDQFRTSLLKEVQDETNRRNELIEKNNLKSADVMQLLAIGKANLNERLQELEMSDVETPSELLNRSKQMVTDHKEITQKCATIENEIAFLEGRVRSSVPYGDKLIESINDDVPILSDTTVADRYYSLIQQTCQETGNTMAPVRVDGSEHEGAQEGMLSPGSAPSRRQRQRPRVSTSKRGGANAKPLEENSEEMERQIKEIVQKALLVDSAAKEKERRQRGNEKKPSKSSSVVGIPVSSIGSSHGVAVSQSGGSVPVSSSGIDQGHLMSVPLPRTAPFTAAALPPTPAMAKKTE